MTDYNNYIKGLAGENKNTVFYNSGPQHAAMVMETIFENARDIVKIYAGCFSGEVSGKNGYKKALETFLNSGGKLQVLLQKDSLSAIGGKPEIFELFRFYSLVKPGSIEVKVHPFKVVKSDDTSKKEIHFTVADDKMYRLEDDTVKFTALGNFNDPEGASSLSGVFDEIFNRKGVEKIDFFKKDLVSQ